MLYKTRGIVLHSIPYNDKYSIIYMYTESFGRVAYLVARTLGKKSNLSRALFMPLSVLEMEVDHKHNRDLHRVRETKSCFPINELSSHPVKNVLALFLSEVLFRVVKETEPDARLALFPYTVAYAPVKVSFSSTFEGIANFIWKVRDFPTTVEVKSATLTRGLPFMKMELLLWVYQRGAAIGQAPASGAPSPAGTATNPVAPRVARLTGAEG